MNAHTATPDRPNPVIELIRRLRKATHRPEPANDPTICAICGAPLTDSTSSICPDCRELEKARWYLCHVIDHDEKIAWTRQQHAILDTLANDPAIPDAEAHTWAKLRQGFPYSALACLDRLIEHERNQQ